MEWGDNCQDSYTGHHQQLLDAHKQLLWLLVPHQLSKRELPHLVARKEGTDPELLQALLYFRLPSAPSGNFTVQILSIDVGIECYKIDVLL